MKKANIIKKSYDITNIIEQKRIKKNKYFSIYIGKNNLNYYRFAICVSTKIGNAVTRNKRKRQVKDIIDKSNLIFKTSIDYVIIIKKPINELNYIEIRESLINLLKEAIRLGEENEKK